jgi:protoporphyrinogen oxidase
MCAHVNGEETTIDILGGGPAGLAVAHYAARAGHSFRLFERSGELGGLCRTYACGRHRYDSGAHRFHDRDPEITGDLRTLLGDELIEVDAPSQVFHRGRFLDFPPRPVNWLRHCGVVEGARAATALLWRKLLPRPERTFTDLVANRYGLRLGRPLLLDYSEKLWGLPGDELAPEVATRRLAGLSLRNVLAELLLARPKSAHLDGRFLYPRSGYGAICAGLAAPLSASSVRTGAEIAGFDCVRGRIAALRLASGEAVAVEGRVASTLPLSLTVRMLGDQVTRAAHEAASGLRFRHVRLIFLRLDGALGLRNASIYLPEKRFAISRVSVPRNRSAVLAPENETGLVAEVPCWNTDAIARLADAELARRVVDELAEAGLLTPSSVLEWRHHLLANAYPVYTLDYRQRVDTIVRELGAIGNLDLLGRNGRFWYSHLHDQLRAAKDYVGSLPPVADSPGRASGRPAARSVSPPSPTIAAHILRSASTL